MRAFLIRAAIVAIGLWVASQVVTGVEIRSGGALIAAAALLAIVNAIVRPIIIILTLPITLLTLGLFLLIINGLMVELVGSLLSGFHVDGLWPAIWTSLIVSLCGWVVNGFIGPEGRIETIEIRRY